MGAPSVSCLFALELEGTVPLVQEVLPVLAGTGSLMLCVQGEVLLQVVLGEPTAVLVPALGPKSRFWQMRR